jgi:putative hemolysin
MAATNAQLLFGCASIKTESPRQAALLYNHFAREGRIKADLVCPPTVEYSMPNLGLWIEKMNRPTTLEEQTEIYDLIPSLCRAYLKAGALLGGEPAYDPAFKCIDFLTILPRENLNKVLWRKYSSCATSEEETPSHSLPNPTSTSSLQV